MVPTVSADIPQVVLDADDFVVLLRRHYSLVYGILLARIGDRVLAQELTREVFLLAWFQRNALPEESAVWFRRLARRIGRRWSRNAALRRDVLQRYRHVGPYAVVDDERQALGDEQAALLDSLAPLRKRDRDLVVLDYLLGHATRDAAHSLGLGHRRAKDLLAHARKLVPPHLLAAVGSLIAHDRTEEAMAKEIDSIARSVGVWPVIAKYVSGLPTRWLRQVLGKGNTWPG